MHATARIERRTVEASAELWSTVRPAWRRLLERTGEPSTFLAESWIESWLETFGERLATEALIWEDGDGDTVACALLSRGGGRLGRFPVERTYLNASGAVEVGCDHNDVLVLDEHRSAVIDDLAELLLRRGGDEVALQGVRPGLFEELRRRWPWDAWNGYESESPYVDLARVRDSGEEYLAQLSSNSRSKIRRSIRLYEEAFGDAEVEVARTPEVALDWLDELVELHEATWESRGEEGAFTGSALPFHRAVVRRAAGPKPPDELAADIVRIRFGDETVGLLYNTIYRGRISFYQSGLKYHDDSKLKPGLVTHALSVEHYVDRGEAEYDFLGGEPEPVQYKGTLATDRRRLYWAQLPVPSLKVRALYALRRGRRRLRRLRSQDES